MNKLNVITSANTTTTTTTTTNNNVKNNINNNNSSNSTINAQHGYRPPIAANAANSKIAGKGYKTTSSNKG